MKTFLHHSIIGFSATKQASADSAGGPFTGKYLYSAALSLLFLFFISSTAFADHFKGGHYSYKALGEGKYEFLIKGYWHKDHVNNIYLRGEGFPKIHGFPITVSKTLLSDGETVELVQKFTLSWAKPGSYKVYWKTCCRGVGSNYGTMDEMGMLGVVNFNPDALSSSPVFYDHFKININAGNPLEYRTNIADPDGHEQEYTLVNPYGVSSDAYAEMQSTGFQLNGDGTILWENPLEGKWAVTIRLLEKINGTYTGAYIDREYIINVGSGSKQGPVFTAIEAKAVKAGNSLSFDVEASDAEGYQITLSANGSPFEKGAGFSQTVQGNLAQGTFSWATPSEATGTYNVQFVATDNSSTPLSSYLNVAITVAECTEFTPDYTIEALPCKGSSNGKISLNTTAGFSPYQFSLDNGLTYQNDPFFENLAPGNYTALILDAIGCSSLPVTIILEEAPLPEVSLNLPSAICFNAGSLALVGGSPEGGTYQGAGVENGFFYPEKAGVGSHILNYTYTNANGCSNTASAEIVVNEVPVADAGLDQLVFAGAGEKGCATLTASATGGSSPYSYHWSTGETSESIKVCPMETTSYLLTVTDASGCVATDEVTVVAQEPGNFKEKAKEKKDKKDKNNNGNKANARSSDKLISLAENESEVVVFPNPITENSQLKVKLEEADIITIDILDLSGRVVKKLYAGNIEAKQVITFGLKDQVGEARIFICRVITSKKVYSVKLLMR